MSRIFEAAQAYVMLTRFPELEQLVIINSVPTDKIYPSPQAMAEVEKMNYKAFNWINEITNLEFKIVSLNIRSRKKHLVDLNGEPQIKGSDVIQVQQTCLGISECIDGYQLPGYMSHFNSYGDGKGIALYHKEDFKQMGDVKKEKYQISKLYAEKCDIISVYRSSDTSKANMIDFLTDLRTLFCSNKKKLNLGRF